MVCSLHQFDVRHRLSNVSITFPAVSPNSGVDCCSVLDKLWGEWGAANNYGLKCVTTQIWDGPVASVRRRSWNNGPRSTSEKSVGLSKLIVLFILVRRAVSW